MKNKFMKQVACIVICVSMLLSYLPFADVFVSAAKGPFVNFEKYGIEITGVDIFDHYFGSSGQIKVYHTLYLDDHVYNGVTLNISIDDTPNNGKATVNFNLSYNCEENGGLQTREGSFELDCSCTKEYKYGSTSPRVYFEDGKTLYIYMKKTPTQHTMSYSSNGNNSHTVTCSTCKKTYLEKCSGDASATCQKAGTCSFCGRKYVDSSVHEWEYSQEAASVFAKCKCGRSESAIITSDLEEYYYTSEPINPCKLYYSTNWPGEKPAREEILHSNNTEVGTASGSVTINGITITKTFKILPADIQQATVNLLPESGTYTGSEQKPNVSVTYKDKPLAENTDYTLSWDKSNLINADSYTVTITGKGNYEGNKEAQFIIKPTDVKDAVVTLDQNTFVYNGQTHKPTVKVNREGAVLTEGVDYDLYYMSSDQVMEWDNDKPTKFFGNTSSDSINVGQYYAVVFGKGNYAANGQFAYASYTIEKAVVTVPAIEGKTYNGSVQTADITDTDLYTVEKNDGGTSKGNYDVVLKLKDSVNYKWSTTDSAEVTVPFAITKATNEWTATPSISGWTYGETANTPVGASKYGTVKVVYSGKANDGFDYSSETAPTKAGNYTATFTVAGTEDYSSLFEQVNFTIAKKAITVTAKDAGKIYGDSDPALTYTNTALVGQDTLDVIVSRASGENANTYTITASQEDGANPNYEITFKTGTLTIYKASLTVTAEDKALTYGDDVPNYTVKYDGFKNGDDKDDLGGTLDFYHDYRQFDDVGEYEIKPRGLTSDNYVFFYNPGKLTVSPKPITVTIQNATSDYGEAPAELKATDNGIVNDDKDVYSLSTTATSTSNVGKYAITGAALDSNYNITFVNGEYEITKRKLTITVDEKNVVVNTELPAYTYKVEGLMGEDKLVTEPIFTCNADVTVIGEYDIIASGADAGGNYSINYAPAKLRILINTENIEKVKDVTSENVTLENKTDLEKAKADLKKALADGGDNYTESEKKTIEDEIKRIEDALEVIGNVEAVEKLIGKLPKEITKADEASVLAAKKAFDTLSDYEKTLVLAEYKEVLKNAEETLAKLVANADTESPNTGEGSNVWVLFALMASIGSGILGITIRRKKKISL